jgi:hypothetical protein
MCASYCSTCFECRRSVNEGYFSLAFLSDTIEIERSLACILYVSDEICYKDGRLILGKVKVLLYWFCFKDVVVCLCIN